MSEHCHDTTIMFADIAGSTALYTRLGDSAANQLIASAVKQMCDITVAHHGRVIKTIGDEVMAQFPHSADACRAASDMQHQSQEGNPPYDLRIGIATGPAIERGGDVFGEVVNDAAAVARIAQAQQILGSQALGELPAIVGAFQWRPFDQIKLKGKHCVSTIYRLNWQTTPHNKATRIYSIELENGEDIPQRLSLFYQGDEVIIGPEDTPYIIGRDRDRVHLTVDSHFASRQHLQIVYRRGKYVLIDQSTNGCYIRPDKGDEIYLRREELPLTHCGHIGLGESTDQSSGRLIFYSTQKVRAL